MSLSKSTLAAIQQAGQGLHQATVVVAAAVREQAEHMVATVASQPFQAEGEQAFANFRMLARLSQDLQSLEEQLRGLYATASELASPEMDVVAQPRLARARPAVAAPDAGVEDAVVKPASTRRTKAPARRAGRRAAASGLTVNDTKVLSFLKTALKAGEWTALTGAAIAQGAGMPLGSVGISLKKVVAAGHVKKRGKGSYRLGA